MLALNDLRLLHPSRCISHLSASEKEEWALMQEPSYMRIPRPIRTINMKKEREKMRKSSTLIASLIANLIVQVMALYDMATSYSQQLAILLTNERCGTCMLSMT